VGLFDPPVIKNSLSTIHLKINNYTMIRLLFSIAVSATAVLATSCGCCTSDIAAPKLPSMPQFQEIPTAPVQVEYTK
jgi:hypothetical protein